MSKTISCPFCQAAITVDENASMVVCLSCGKGFALGVSAQSGAAQQFTQAPPNHGFVPPPPMPPNHGFVPPPPMPPYQAMAPQIKRRRPGNGLFLTGVIFNSLAILAGVGMGWSLAAYLEEGTSSMGEIAMIFSVFGFPFILTALILDLVAISKYWSLLPSQFSCEITPGGAAGFMLIPIFNLYWIWVLHLRLGSVLRQTACRPNPAKGCGVAAAILIFLGTLSPFTLFLQYIGYLIALCGYQKAAKIIEP